MSRRRTRNAAYRSRRLLRQIMRWAGNTPAFLGPLGGTFTYDAETVTDLQLAAYKIIGPRALGVLSDPLTPAEERDLKIYHDYMREQFQ